MSLPPALSRLARILRRQGWAIALVAGLMLYLFTPPEKVADTTLDVSNFTSYAHFTATGVAYGGEVLPMVGPYGFVLYGEYYGGYLYWTRIAIELGVLLGFGVLVVWFMRWISGWGWRALWLVGVLTMIPNISDAAFDLAILLSGLFLVLAPRCSRRELAWHCVVAAYVAFLALLKGTQFNFALLTLAVATAGALRDRAWRAALIVPGAFLFALLGWWSLAGQSPLDLPRFVHGMIELSHGYNDAMGLQEPDFAFRTGAAAGLLLLGGCAAGILLARFRPPLAGAFLLVAAFTFISWKHGFVRADGHVMIFYRYAGLLAGFLPALFTRLEFSRPAAIAPAPAPWLALGPMGMAFVFSVLATGEHSLAILRWEIETMLSLPGKHLGQFRSLGETSVELERRLASARSAYALPRIRRQVGDAPIDFFGTEHGYLLLNDLNYHPRPMGGGAFNVFTSWLQQQNADFIADSSRAPDYYLVHLGSIDNRIEAQDDPLALHAILTHYEPVDAERGMLLLQRRATPLPAELRPVAEATVVFEEWIELPEVSADEMLFVRFDLPLGFDGRLRSFLYKPPLLFAHVDGPGIGAAHYLRLLPPMVRNPIPISPYLAVNRDLLDLQSDAPAKRAARIMLSSPQPGLWQTSGLRAEFFAAPRPRLPADTVAGLQQRIQFPTTSEPPLEIVPTDSPLREIDGRLVRMIHPLGHLAFKLDGDETTVSFAFGLLDGSWQGGGETDGISVRVELRSPSGSSQELYRRDIRPATVPADRGRQTAQVPIPAIFEPGSVLYLKTDYGPDNNGAWDWSYLADVRINGAPFRALQFPGFDLLPQATEGTHCAVLGFGERRVVLLSSPGALIFDLPSKPTQLTFGAGLIEGAYLEGQTDGADYIIEQLRVDAAPEELYRRELRPLDTLADRGTVTISVPLPAGNPGDRFRIRIDPGPAGNGAWDWTYLEQLHLQ